jgi:hypothetical protein|tara:strand:+ start:34 stop:255 length:222 start_codon:yes stop_codon:yes gene_type:complete
MNGIKFNGGVTLGNVLIIISLIVSLSMAWTSISSSVDTLREKVSNKADKDVVEVKFDFIQKELKEIKGMLKDK